MFQLKRPRIPTPAAHGPTQTECVHCGFTFARRLRYCPGCAVDSQSDEAVQIRELNKTRRQISQLAQSGHLANEMHSAVFLAIDRKKEELLQSLKKPEVRAQLAQPALYPSERQVAKPRLAEIVNPPIYTAELVSEAKAQLRNKRPR